MPWVKLDDNFPDDLKIHGLSDPAYRMYVSGLCLSNRLLSDGHLPAPLVRKLVPRFRSATVAELVAAGLWQESAGGWFISAWAEHNESASTIKTRRAREREKKQRQRTTGAQAVDKDAGGRFVSPGESRGSSPDPSRGESPATHPTPPHPTPGLDTSAAAANPRSRPDVLAAAAALIAERQGLHERAATKDNPQRWLDASVRGIANDHQQQAFDLLRQYPDTTAEQLADMLTDPAPRLRAVPTPSNLCPDCDQPLGASHTPNGCEIEQRAKAATR